MARLEDLRNEYKEASSHFRYLATFRLGLLSFFGAFIAGIVRFMWDVYTVKTVYPLRILLPVGGLMGSFMVYYVERRLLQLYDIIAVRAFNLEETLDITDGMYRRLQSIPGRPTLRRVATIVFFVIALSFAIIIVVETLHYF